MHEETFLSICVENRRLIGEMNLHNMYTLTPSQSTADFLRSKTSDTHVDKLVDENRKMNIINDEPLK